MSGVVIITFTAAVLFKAALAVQKQSYKLGGNLGRNRKEAGKQPITNASSEVRPIFLLSERVSRHLTSVIYETLVKLSDKLHEMNMGPY